MKKRQKVTIENAMGLVRISKDRPEETSTSSQLERIKGFCAGIDVNLVHVMEVRASAYKDDTAALDKARQHAVRLAQSGAIQLVVAWKFDRVARKARDLLNFIYELEEAGAEFASVTESFNTSTPMGKAGVTIIAALAELESAQKSERITEWQAYRRREDMPPTGPAPYGYRRERNQLIVIDEQAVRIKEVAARLLAGETVTALTTWLNANEPARTFTRNGLRVMLMKPSIAAMREVDGEPVPSKGWTPILDYDTWEAVRAILTDPRRRTNFSTDGRRWLLSGLISCTQPECQQAMQVRSHPGGMRYACAGCGTSIHAAKTDALVGDTVLANLSPEQWRRLRAQGTKQIDVDKLKAEGLALAEDYRNGDIDLDEWRVMRDGLRRRKAEADERRQVLQLPNVDDPIKAWPKLDIDARRLLVMAATPRIRVKPGVRGACVYDQNRVVIEP